MPPPIRSELVEEINGFLSTAEHHRRKEMASMWLLGDHASKLLYDHGLTHNQIVAQSRVSMFELCRALTVRATYRTIHDIPEGTK